MLLATDRGHYIKYFPYMDSPQSIGEYLKAKYRHFSGVHVGCARHTEGRAMARRVRALRASCSLSRTAAEFYDGSGRANPICVAAVGSKGKTKTAFPHSECSLIAPSPA